MKVWLRVLGSVSLSKVQVSLAGAPSIMASSHAQDAGRLSKQGLWCVTDAASAHTRCDG